MWKVSRIAIASVIIMQMRSLFSTTPCQVSETPELTEVVRQFIEANRAPRDGSTDF
ncbi:hypothetical protein [Nostoc parmelioides]|uniref:Uncharacterized protein n=1 Tax=Nostoc parmelioides FACHB-3921 TaxID=2692909 RepID=A0ABR8BQI8_9NOSO|nr:hypothetical protein [Nostoc parmelioides]MBD2255584.1 hypothetical protein [Nostoc parmelioides FACHB-3921]